MLNVDGDRGYQLEIRHDTTARFKFSDAEEYKIVLVVDNNNKQQQTIIMFFKYMPLNTLSVRDLLKTFEKSDTTLVAS